MSVKVKQLVKEYDEWHVSEVGAYSTYYIEDQHELLASDDGFD